MTPPIKKRINTELINDRKKGFMYQRAIKKRIKKLSDLTEEGKLKWREKAKCE